MLRSLLIRNVVLIDSLELQFGEGLHVFTGETGAGKSILLAAFRLVLGERAEVGLIRQGEAHARVEALFEYGGHPWIETFLETHGFPQGEELLLSRELHRKGRNRCWINGSLATRALLQELGDRLVDLHGQHDHQMLLRSENHLAVLDGYGSKNHRKRVEEASKAIQTYRKLEAWQRDREAAARRRRLTLEHLGAQIEEIREAELTPGEEEDLGAELKRLSHAEEAQRLLGEALQWLDGEDSYPGALEGLGHVSQKLEEVIAKTGAFQDLGTRLDAWIEELNDFRHDLEMGLREIPQDPARMQEVEDRMAEIHRLSRKYGNTTQEILSTLAAVEAEHRELSQDEQGESQKEADFQRLSQELGALLPAISQERQKLARKLSKAIEGQIRDLSMPGAQVQIALETQPDPRGLEAPGAPARRLYAEGFERARIDVATNPGEAPGSLSKIASGGEISRVMLGIKAALAQLEAVPIMVFDEIDVGVGGETGKKMAAKLHAVSRSCQCLCVTHLPSIAAVADRHYHVEKSTHSGRTHLKVIPLDEDQRVAEISRMLGGAGSAEGLGLARELMRPKDEPARKGKRA